MASLLGAACALSGTFEPSAVAAGTKAWGYVPVLDSLAASVNVPVMVINGASDGPTFTVTVTYPSMPMCGWNLAI